MAPNGKCIKPRNETGENESKAFCARSFVVVFITLATICASSTPQKPNQNPNKMKHFVLVHGASHRAWCWYKLTTLLTAAGHNVTTLDLPGSGIDPTQVQQIHSITDYSEPLIKLMESLPPHDRVILVGHNLGGLPISLLMERFPRKIAAAVFATASMPGLNISLATISEEINSSTHGYLGRNTDFMDTQYRFDDGSDKPATAVFFGPKFLASSLYQLSPPEDLTLALTLARWAPLFHEKLVVTRKKYGSISKIFIMTEQDRSIKPNLQLLMIAKNPPNEVKVINGSDHMVMFSRPMELFTNLLQIAQKYS
ncbi:methyl jasmonate esterase 1-like [Rosa rugosa]|uniref:methyl jasmonate esterase 1-like n=1 Tax=Rosa rugosa TaxID=74645 RepID=UPI002B4163CC|nr:methyl jasmonate esterase 1-like [Rosa rugosa]